MSSTSPHKPSEYHKMIAEALDDEFLRRTLDKFAVEYRASRDKVFAEVDGADLIRRIADRKDWAAQHLEERLFCIIGHERRDETRRICRLSAA